MKNNDSPELHQILDQMGSLLGLLFQRGDDLLDFDIRNEEKKAVLGDLKSGYLNSFGAFLSKDFSMDQKAKLKSCKTLEDVYALIGQANFTQAVTDFDHMNDQAIELYNHLAESLAAFLDEKEKPLIADLRPLARVLYYRTK